MTTTTKKPTKAATKAAPKPPAKKPAARTAKAKAEPVPPAPPKFGGSITMPAADLKRIIECVAPAASTDEARPMLCNLHIEPGAISVFEATDSYRVHQATATVLDADGTPVDIPAWWLRRWAKVKQQKSAIVTLTWSDWSAAESCTATISVEPSDVTESIRIYKPTGPGFPDVSKFTMSTDGQVLFGSFNPRYLAAALAACAKWATDWRPVILDPLKPALFRASSDIGTFSVALMPVRVPEGYTNVSAEGAA